ncbi:MAG: phosphatase PAP2 family protein [Rhodobacteraceae bacterium]|nr:phosphatase PAP2 family protein [Paracoccaceae bacterium]
MSFSPLKELRLPRPRVLVVLGIIALVFAFSVRSVERTGDRLQIALPLLGLGCAMMDGKAIQYTGRFLLMETILKSSKYGLGDAAINQRPNGGDKGFPSGHTTAAVFGATALVNGCLKESRAAQGLVIMTAGFVGGSRIEAGAHTLWQVVAGALLGWLTQFLALRSFDRGFRAVVSFFRRKLAELALVDRIRKASMAIAKTEDGSPSRSRLGLLVAGFVVLAAALVAATTARSEVELAFYSGVQTAPHSTVSGTDPLGAGAFSFGAGWDGRSFELPPYYGLRAIWWRDENLGFSVDFAHSKVYADGATLAASGFPVLEFTDGLNVLIFGVNYRWPEQWGRFTPYVSGGLGVAIPHVEVQTTAAAPTTLNFQLAGPSAAISAGVSYSLNERWALFGEYRGTYSKISADLTGGGTLKTDIITNSLNLGVSFKF